MKDSEKEFILSYAKNNMNLSETAKELHYHYNSVHYKLNNIAQKYSLNPNNFYDLIELVKMAMNRKEEYQKCIHNEVCEYGKNPDSRKYCLSEKCKYFIRKDNCAEIVLCKECIFFRTSTITGKTYCRLWGEKEGATDYYCERDANHFCSYGQRKEANQRVRDINTERKHGEWEQGDYYDIGDVCSVCQYDSEKEPCQDKFCPNCGADMRGEDG